MSAYEVTEKVVEAIESKEYDLIILNYANPDMVGHTGSLEAAEKALEALKRMAQTYGFDISGPATNSREAVQWLYFAYLAAIKDQNGAAMSIGRTSTFLDIYFERDLKAGTITEEEVQELMTTSL